MTDLFHRTYFSLFPQGDTVTPRAHGLDISKYDLRFTPATATGQLDFVIQRISYRQTRDEAFETLLPGVMQVPIRGGYHYLNSDTAWRTQADKYLSIIAGHEYHFHACDFEGAFNALSTDFAYQAWQWVQYVQGRTGKRVFLYTSPSLYGTYIYPSQARYGINWNTVPLWTAQWFLTPNPNGTPSNPTGRTGGWSLWQYTSKGNGTLYGAGRSTACDLDVFNGTVPQMRNFLGIGVEPPPPPPGGDVDYYEIKSNSTTDYRSIRSQPDIRGSLLKKLLPGQIAKAGVTVDDVKIYAADVPNGMGGLWAKAGDMWRRVYEADGQAFSGWIAKIHLGKTYITERLVTVVEPPPPPPPTGTDEVVVDVDVTATINGNVYAGTVSGIKLTQK